MMTGQFSHIVKILGNSPKQTEENQSQIITGERLSSWNLSLIAKIILIIFTTANDSPNVAHRPFGSF